MRKFLTIAFLIFAMNLFVSCVPEDEDPEEYGDIVDTGNSSSDNNYDDNSGNSSNEDNKQENNENQGGNTGTDTGDTGNNQSGSGSDNGDTGSNPGGNQGDNGDSGSNPGENQDEPGDTEAESGNDAEPGDDTESGNDAEPGDTEAESGNDAEPGDDTESGDDTEPGDDTESGDDTETGDDTEPDGDTEEPDDDIDNTEEPQQVCTEINLGTTLTDYSDYYYYYDRIYDYLFYTTYTPKTGDESTKDYFYMNFDGISPYADKTYNLSETTWNSSTGIFLFVYEDEYYDDYDEIYKGTKTYFQKEGTVTITYNYDYGWFEYYYYIEKAEFSGVVLKEINTDSGEPVPEGACLRIKDTTIAEDY